MIRRQDRTYVAYATEYTARIRYILKKSAEVIACLTSSLSFKK